MIRRTIVAVKSKGGGSWKRWFVKFDCGHVYRFPSAMSKELMQVGKTLRCRDCEFVAEHSHAATSLTGTREKEEGEMATDKLASILATPMRCTRCGKVSLLIECEPCIAPDGSEGTGFGCPEPDCEGYVLEDKTV